MPRKNLKRITPKVLIKLFSSDLLKIAEQTKPKKRYKLNLFNSGVIIDSEKVRKSTIEVLKELLKYY